MVKILANIVEQVNQTLSNPSRLKILDQDLFIFEALDELLKRFDNNKQNTDAFFIQYYPQKNSNQEVCAFIEGRAANSFIIILENGRREVLKFTEIDFKKSVQLKTFLWDKNTIPFDNKDFALEIFKFLKFSKIKEDTYGALRRFDLNQVNFPQYPAFNSVVDEVRQQQEANVKLLSSQPNSNLSDYCLKETIVLFEATTRAALNNSHIKNRLNAIEPKKDVQTFPNSCVARTLMRALFNLKLINEYSRSKELEIYHDIWLGPGESTDLERFMQYLQKFKKSLNVVSIEIDSLTQQNINSPNIRSSLLNAYSIFKKLPNVRHYTVIDEKLFLENIPTLIVTTGGKVKGEFSLDGHVILCTKIGNVFKIYNSHTGQEKEYTSLKTLVEEEDFVGVYFQLKPTQQNNFQINRIAP